MTNNETTIELETPAKEHLVWQGRDVQLCEGVAVDTSYESAEDMWDSLGNHWTWESDDNDGQVVHPVCTIEQLDTQTDAQILAAECPAEACDEERAAYAEAIDYARSALDDMRSIESSLQAAVSNYELGDLAGTIEHLGQARREEQAYGDSPAADALADALLEDVEETSDAS